MERAVLGDGSAGYCFVFSQKLARAPAKSDLPFRLVRRVEKLAQRCNWG
jgi:hypothetical protein